MTDIYWWKHTDFVFRYGNSCINKHHYLEWLFLNSLFSIKFYRAYVRMEDWNSFMLINMKTVWNGYSRIPNPNKWVAAWQNQQNDLCAQRRLRSAWASAQSGRIPRLIWVFAGRTCWFVGFVMRRLDYDHKQESYTNNTGHTYFNTTQALRIAKSSSLLIGVTKNSLPYDWP